MALKKLDLAAYGEDRRQFVVNSIKAEYGAAIGLNHPGVARVRDLLIEPRGEVYIVQEFIDGPTLRQLYDSGAPTEQRVALLADVADALAALHAKGVVHRDVKPENVVVRDGKWPVLIDLGIALVTGSPDALERFGTPPYVAPEQARGGKVDFRADIYALGQMIAEIWGAKLPGPFQFRFFGWRPQAMPPALGRLARRMLRANPERRYCDLKIIAASLRAEQVHSALAADGVGLVPVIDVEHEIRGLRHRTPHDDFQGGGLVHRHPRGRRQLELARLPRILLVAQEVRRRLVLDVDADRDAARGIGDETIDMVGLRLELVGRRHQLQ